MSEGNQNPVYTDSSLSGDGTVVDPLSLSSSGPGRAFDIGVFNPGAGSNAQKVLILNIQRNVLFPAGAANSKFTAAVAATGSTTFTFLKNGVAFATAVFAPAGTLAVFTQAANANFAIGDQLSVTGPATADATLADFTFTLSGSRT